MTVSEYLKENKNQIIKIGTLNGSSFLYCGVIDDYTEKQLSDILDRERDTAISKLNKDKNQFDNFDTFWERSKTNKKNMFMYKNFLELNKAVDEKIMIAYDTKLERGKLNKYDKLKSKINYYYMLINQWKSVQDRKVIETYKTYESKDLDINVLIMDGYEIGKYWTVEEFKKEYNNYRKES